MILKYFEMICNQKEKKLKKNVLIIIYEFLYIEVMMGIQVLEEGEEEEEGYFQIIRTRFLDG